MIKSGGENIYPAEIEKVLLADDRIAQAVVVRMPNAEWGEVPVAFIVPSKDTLTKADVLECCQYDLSSYKHPRAIVFVEASELPRSTTGTVRRHDHEQLL